MIDCNVCPIRDFCEGPEKAKNDNPLSGFTLKIYRNFNNCPLYRLLKEVNNETART